MSTTISKETGRKNQRRIQRIALTLPIKIEGRDSSEEAWTEITRLKDISAFGAGFGLARPIKRGRLILITLPMPRKMRCYDYMEPQYRVWGIVRRCIKLDRPASREEYFIGVAFIGRVPPKSYLEDPSIVYEISNRDDDGLWTISTAESEPVEDELPKEDRRHSRFDIPVAVVVEVINEDGQTIKKEETVTENISLSGAAIFSSINIEVGSFIKITAEQYQTSIKAVIRGKRIGPDGIPRLHIEFIDSFFPLEGIED